MKKKISLLVVAIFAVAFFYFKKNQNTLIIENETLEHSGAFEGLIFNNERMTYPSGQLPKNAHYAAWEKLQNTTASVRTNDPLPWETIGPHNRGGRTLALALNPENTNTLWAGSASGGLWKSHSAGDGEQAWTRVPTGYPVLGVSSITFAPDDTLTMYIGTGEVYNYYAAGTGAADRATRGTYGMGILKTTDGGATWTKSLDWSYDQNHGVWAIKIDPTNSNNIFAATTEGVYKSTDAGASWDQVLDVIMANDLLINPNDPQEIVVGCGNFGTPGHGIYKTTDGGSDWFQLIDNIPDEFLGKVQLGISPSSPNIIYASIGNGFSVNSPDNKSWLLRSEDFGNTWILKNTTDYSRWQGWFSHDVAVSPTNPDSLVVIGINIWRSENGGDSLRIQTDGGIGFSNPPIAGPDGAPDFVHSDAHDVIFHPTNPNKVYVASDGGIHKSEDAGETWFSASGSYQTAQFYNGMANSNNDSTFFMGGLQDNGTIRWNGDLTWRRILGGDGCWSAIHPADDEIYFASWQRLSIRRTLNGGMNTQFMNFGDAYLQPVAFVAPYKIAPSDPNILYAGSSLMAKTTNLGDDWTAVNAGVPLDGNPILSIDVSPENEDVVYAGTAPFDGNPGNIFVTTDGNTFDEVTGNLPDRFPMDIAVDPTDEATAYVVFSGFGTGHVFKTTNYGGDWEDISADLPDVPHNAVVVDPMFPNHVYVGNDLGVFVSLDGGATWEIFMDGLPEAVLAFDLVISPLDRKLRMGSHGNGAFQRDLFENDPVASEDKNLVQLEWNIFPNPSTEIINIQFQNTENQQISIHLHDAQGKFVQPIFEGFQNAEQQQIQLDISSIAAGIYFVKFSNEKNIQVKKLVIQ